MRTVRYVYYTLVILLASCGRGVDTRVDHGQFQMYVDRFVAAAKERGYDDAETDAAKIAIEFGNTDAEEPTGKCSKPLLGVLGGRTTITFKESIWNAVNDDARTVLMIHEMGHCVFGFDHQTTGIMEPRLDIVQWGRRFKDSTRYYLDEFFSLNCSDEDPTTKYQPGAKRDGSQCL